MVSKEQVFNGIIRYLDFEVMPHLPTYAKWGIGTYVTLLSGKFDKAYNAIIQSGALNIVDTATPEGLIDIDKLSVALAENANKYGKWTVTIPGLKPMSFNQDDIILLKEYIKGEK